MDVRYWDWTQTPRRDDYEIAAIRLALEKTVPDWGEFKLTRVALPLSTPRARAAIQRGEVVNVHVAPWRPPVTDPRTTPYSLRVNVGLAGGIMGCRSLFIRAADRERFKHVNSEQALRQLTVGQGRGWFDVDILRANQLPVEDSGDISSLFSMLVGKRFDYVAMSMMEVDTLTRQPEVIGKHIEVVPDLMLYYPLPLVAYVSLAAPQLAQRLDQGLRMARADGSLDQLTQQHFHEEIARFKAQNPRVIVLKNPMLPAELAKEMPVCAH